MTFLFATGIENSYPTLAGGVRFDQMDRTGHYAWWERDFELARSLGVSAVRYGPAYYRTHVAPDDFCWESADEPMYRLRELGLGVVADLCHFGVTNWLAGFQDEAFPVLFGEYARAFARQYPWVRYFTPVNQIFRCATNSALLGVWNECLASDVAFVRALRNLCMAHELAVEAILAERPDAIIVQAEALVHHHPAGTGAAWVAERWNTLRYLALDLTAGHELAPGIPRYLHEHGISATDLRFFQERRAVGQRWLGLVYPHGAEARVATTGRRTMARSALGFAALAAEYHRRYRLPVFHLGTHRAGRPAEPWLREQWEQVMALRTLGVPLTGFTWDPLIDPVVAGHGNRSELVEAGLFDHLRRERPVAGAYREIVARWNGIVSAPVAMHAREASASA